MPEVGVEEKGVEFGRIHLRVRGGKDVGYCEGETVEKLVNDFKECGNRLKVCN